MGLIDMKAVIGLVIYQWHQPKGTIILKTKPFTDINLVEKWKSYT